MRQILIHKNSDATRIGVLVIDEIYLYYTHFIIFPAQAQPCNTKCCGCASNKTSRSIRPEG